jgi:uncharacterized protein YjiS (DUF1127 family)
MTTTTINRSGRGRSSLLRQVPAFVGRIVRGLVDYSARSRAEQQLESLDERLLRDIGIARNDIHRMVWGDGR